MLAEAIVFLPVILPLFVGFKIAWECVRVRMARLDYFCERAT